VKLCTVLQKYLEQAQDLVFNENVLLQTLGFDVAIDHPHTHVVRCCHLVRGKCLAVVTRRGGKCRQQVYILGLPKLNETIIITNIWYGITCWNVFLCTTLSSECTATCVVRNLHISYLLVCTVFKLTLMCQ